MNEKKTKRKQKQRKQNTKNLKFKQRLSANKIKEKYEEGIQAARF